MLDFDTDLRDYEKLIDEHGDFNSYLDATKILCKSLKTKEIYISAEGLVTPCCWTAGKLYKTYEELGKNQMWSYIDDIKNINALQKRFISARFSLSVGSIINVPATGQDIVGA